MSKPFSKINFPLPLGMETAVPVDYNSFFTSYDEASAAAATARPAGSTDSIYYFGQQVYVVDDTQRSVKTFLISHDGTLLHIATAATPSGGTEGNFAVFDSDGNVQDSGISSGVVPADASISNELADKEFVDRQIDRVAAYYITANLTGGAFQTLSDLLTAEHYYSGGQERTPTRNDYAVVLADEDHGNDEWRYIFAVPDTPGATGQWEPQYPIETNDYNALSDKPSINHVTLSGNLSGAELGLRNLDDLSYDRTVQETAWNVVLSSGGTVLDTANLFGSETVPTPSGLVKQIKWRGTGTSGSAITVEQNASSLTTAWLFYYDIAPANVFTTITNNSTDPNPTSLIWSDVPSGTSLAATKGTATHTVPDTLALSSQVPALSDTDPLTDGTASPGTAETAARSDHVHPKDDSKADKTYVDAKSSIKSPDGDTVVSADNDGTAKVAKTTSLLGNATVTFPQGFSITSEMATYTAPSVGESIEFFGPIDGPYGNSYWVPSQYSSLDYFDPSEHEVWCLYGGPSMPMSMMYITGPMYAISNWDSTSQTLTLSYGTESGDPPTMSRADESTTVTKTVATTDQIPEVVSPSSTATTGQAADAKGTYDELEHKLDKRGGTITGVVGLQGSTTGYPLIQIKPDGIVLKSSAPGVKTDLFNIDVDTQPTSNSRNLMTSGRIKTALDFKADKVSEATAGNLAKFDGEGNLADSGFAASAIPSDASVDNKLATESFAISSTETHVASAVAIRNFSADYSFAEGDYCLYDGALYRFDGPHEGNWDASDTTKVCNLSSDAAPVPLSDNIVTSGVVKAAIDAIDLKPKRLWNEVETDSTDDKGQLYTSVVISDTGNYFNRVGYGRSPYMSTMEGTYDGVSQTIYLYSGDGLAYIPSSGNIYRWYKNMYSTIVVDTGTLRMTATPNLNPTLPDVDLDPQQVQGESTWTFTPRTIVSSMETTPYAHFALESMPTRTFETTATYAVGDLVEHGGAAYRCNTKINTAESWNPSHWTQIEVLSQKLSTSAFETWRDSSSSSFAGNAATASEAGTADYARELLAQDGESRAAGTLFSRIDADFASITSIESKIPVDASADNLLSTEGYVDDAVSTNTATFLGTYDYVGDLHFPAPTGADMVDNDAIATVLGTLTYPTTADNNDYVFVSVDFTGTTPEDEYRRFKYNGENWAYEYTLNNSSFTYSQWNAINSGVTSSDVEKLGGIESGAQVNVIETVKVNGVESLVENKSVDIAVPLVASPSLTSSDIGKAADAYYTGVALSSKADYDDVVRTTGDQTVSGEKTFDGILTLKKKNGDTRYRFASNVNEKLMVQRPASTNFPQGLTLFFPTADGTQTLATVSQIGLPAFDAAATYAVGDNVVLSGAVYGCTTAVTAAGEWASVSGDFDKLFDIATAAPSTGGTNLVTNGQVQDALDALKPTRIYNATGTDALDDKGALYHGDLQLTTGTRSDGKTFAFTYKGSGSGPLNGHTLYQYKLANYVNCYIYVDSSDDNSVGFAWQEAITYQWKNVTWGKLYSPCIAQTFSNVEFNTSTIAGYPSGVSGTYNVTFNGPAPYAHFALESLPDRTWAAGVWAVGDLVKYSDKAYRCKAATTSSDTTAPSSDTEHWEEIPVLAQKAPVESPSLSGIPTTPDVESGAPDGQIANKKYVDSAVSDAKPTRIYNEAGTNALDDKGQMYTATESVPSFTRTSYGTYRYNRSVTGMYYGEQQTVYTFGAGTPMVYIPSNGYLVYNYSGDPYATCTPHLNPTVPGVDLNPVSVTGTWTYSPRQLEFTHPYARFAIESLPEAWVSGTQYLSGVCVSDGDVAYRCSAETSGSTPPSADAGHWERIPVLGEKAARTELFPEWAANTGYTTYSLVIHENAIYKCTTAHTSGAEWDSTKWAVASGADVLAMLRNYLALSNKPQINGVTLTGEASQTGASLGLRDYNDLSYSEQVVAWPDEVRFPYDYTLPSGVTYRLDFGIGGIPSQIDFYDGDTIVGGGPFETELEPDGLILCIADQIGGEPQYTWPSYVTIKQTRTTVNSKLMRDMSNGTYDTAQKILDAVNGELADKVDDAAIAPEFSTASTYALDDVVMHEGLRYTCAAAVTAAGAWTGFDNWTTEHVQGVFDDIAYGIESCIGSSSQLPVIYSVDSELSTTSTNPVQNRVIAAALGDVETALHIINNGSQS